MTLGGAGGHCAGGVVTSLPQRCCRRTGIGNHYWHWHTVVFLEIMNHKYIAIEGVIGIGKTTLARMLQPRYQAEILLEVFEENPFLADFYAISRECYAFQTQLFFLLSRYHQQHEAIPAALNTLLSDYTFSKDELFAWLY